MIKLYILRHAIAVAREGKQYPNDDRPLSREGIRKMEKEALSFPLLVGGIDVIYSSPLSRAAATAAIAAKGLKYKKKITIIDELLPGSSGEALITRLNGDRRSTMMIVGHEPDLSALIATLTGDDRMNIQLKKGALCLTTFEESIAPGKGKIGFLLQPKQLRSISQ